MLEKLLSAILPKNSVYYPGCLTKFYLKDIYKNYKEILALFGDFIEVPELACCGSPLHSLGFEEEFNAIKEKNLKILAKYPIKMIVFNCPACLSIFKRYYCLRDIKLVHISEFLLQNFKKIENRVERKERGAVVYHDPCHLGRYLGIYDPPREILRRFGYTVVELSRCRAESLCCGGGGGFRVLNPELSRKMAERVVLEAISTGCGRLVTTCPMCYVQLKEAIESYPDLEVLEFSEVIKNALI